MHNRKFNDVSIEQDLGIPLSYDAAWKIFNRWPRGVRVKRQRLGARKSEAPQRSCRYCKQPNCTTRCPFFGLYKKEGVSAEEKLPGIISHQQAEQPRIKSLLNALNEWYNTRCTTGENKGTLDLQPLGPLKMKYKMPMYDLSKPACKRVPAYTWNGNSAPLNPMKTKLPTKKTKSKCGIRERRTREPKAKIERSSSGLYDSIEKQLRNLSVSQSRLRHMSASLCRLAYSKKRATKPKPKPKALKQQKSFYNALEILNMCTSSESPVFESKSSKQSESSKPSERSKPSGESKKAVNSKKSSDTSKTSATNKKSKISKASTDKSVKTATRSKNPKQQTIASKPEANQSSRTPGKVTKLPIKRIVGGGQNEWKPSNTSSESYRTAILKKCSAKRDTKVALNAKTTKERTTGALKRAKKHANIDSNSSVGVLIHGGKSSCEITIDRKEVCNCQGKKKRKLPTTGLLKTNVAALTKLAMSKSSVTLRKKKSISVAAIKDRLKRRR